MDRIRQSHNVKAGKFTSVHGEIDHFAMTSTKQESHTSDTVNIGNEK